MPAQRVDVGEIPMPLLRQLRSQACRTSASDLLRRQVLVIVGLLFCQQLVHDHAERVLVNLLVVQLAAERLGRHVPQRARHPGHLVGIRFLGSVRHVRKHEAIPLLPHFGGIDGRIRVNRLPLVECGLSTTRIRVARREGIVLEILILGGSDREEAEICDVRDPILVEEDIVGLEIAMYDYRFAFVKILHPARDVEAPADRLLGREALLLHDVVQLVRQILLDAEHELAGVVLIH
mmetsp:Transcript_19438/g.32673  ORF Transcript_19438/g.32673 Transcript_19438/m.32673 type:complete len:235 (-) Transcript_19438:630-1334(-)